ncbi:hypothetical protein [Streptomyces sp. NRRL S-87]|uniref:hypothetical protein n=1 Tax=Streptomyces sp. NRRL S-87 TaxID=1463920 RepID=UPI0004BFE908|nr:hypothetical protein [Streptomyces sp. NRRL S-87]
MTTLLEQRYRAVLRMLPADYRARWEEDMVDTYLCGVEEDEQELRRPSLAETASIAALAVRIRLGATGSSPRRVEAGAAIRQFALISVLLQAAGALTYTALGLRAAGAAQGSGEGGWSATFGADPLQVALGLLPLLWAAGYAALVGGRRRAARGLVALAAVPTLKPLVVQLTGGPAVLTAEALVAWVTVAAVCCGFHCEAPRTRLPFLPPGLALAGAGVAVGGTVVAWPVVADPAWGPGWVVVAAAAALLLGRLRAPDRVSPATLWALGAVGVCVLLSRADTLRFVVGAGAGPDVTVPWAAQAGVLALTVVALCVTAVRARRGARSPAP